MLGLRTTIFKVSNLQKAKMWYSKVFESKPYFENQFYIGFNIKGYELGLLLEENQSEKSDNILCYWGVDNIEEKFLFFLNCGALEHEKPNNVGGEIMVVSIKDPWNNVIGIIYNPEFKLPE